MNNARLWDSVCFLGYLGQEQDKYDDCESVLMQAQKGHILIVASALALVEVIWLKSYPKVPLEDKAKIEKFFKADYITVRNVTRATSELAREVVWEHNIKPKDAIHVATTVLHKVPELNTFDKDLLDLSTATIDGHTFTIKKPHAPRQYDLTELAKSAS
jgi:predicted nucleic acid-binding protein